MLLSGYSKMRLPNLVEHDTLHEVTQQSMSWIPLLNIKCHADTQLFLCSLFSPVCLERPIYPCRSLCQAVRAGCEGRMQAYGFPWPPMLDCDKFPLDNDMCITAQSVRSAGSGSQEMETGVEVVEEQRPSSGMEIAMMYHSSAMLNQDFIIFTLLYMKEITR